MYTYMYGLLIIPYLLIEPVPFRNGICRGPCLLRKALVDKFVLDNFAKSRKGG